MKIGIFSDAHGNIGGFDAASRALDAEGVDRRVYLGDAVGYIPDASVVRALLAAGIPWVTGNHEAMMLRDPDAGADIFAHGETLARLSPGEVAAIAALPRSLTIESEGTRCLFVHGSPRDPTEEYVHADTDLAPFAGTGHDAIFMGHTHRTFVREHAGTLYVNVGSCGLPRDGSGEGSACVYDTRTREARLLRFSLAAAARAVLSQYAVAPSVAAILERAIERG